MGVNIERSKMPEVRKRMIVEEALSGKVGRDSKIFSISPISISGG